MYVESYFLQEAENYTNLNVYIQDIISVIYLEKFFVKVLSSLVTDNG